MKTQRLGRTDIEVSEICLGTMTFGEQNSLDDACAQMDYALAHGVNFWDTAEMYPVPPKPETQGRTEQMLGEWFKKTGRRQDVVLATKIAGPAQMAAHIRNGDTRFRAGHLDKAISASLARLHTDYIDLYQLHWPERRSNYFGHLAYTADMAAQDQRDLTDFAETLSALEAEIKRGRIRAIGLSNETPWGLMRFLSLAEHLGLPRVASIQNPYNLLNRSFEVGLAEVAVQEQAGLLAYSPLAFGVLSGKYLHGAQPAEGRLTRWKRFSRYTNPQAQAATESYAQIAQDHGLSLTQMSLAFIREQCFVTSTIIGATTLAQLKENIDSVQIELGTEVMQAIEAIQVKYPNPAP